MSAGHSAPRHVEDALLAQRRPKAKCTSTTVMLRAARSLEKAAATLRPAPPPDNPRYAKPRTANARPVKFVSGKTALEKGDELVKSCQWRQESVDLLSNVNADIQKLDSVVAADDTVRLRRGDAIVHAIARNDELRATLAERPEYEGEASSSPYGAQPRRGGELNAYIDAQLQKLATLHPQGHIGMLSRSAHLAAEKAVVDVGRRYRLEAIASEADACFVPVSQPGDRFGTAASHDPRGHDQSRDDLDLTHDEFRSLVRDDGSSDGLGSTSMGGLTMGVSVGTQTQDDGVSSGVAPSLGGTGASVGSPAGAPAVTARHYITSLHNLIAGLGGFLKHYLRADTDRDEYMSEDVVSVHFVRACRADCQQLGVDTPKGTAYGILQAFRAAAQSSIASQPTAAIFLSAVGHLCALLMNINESTRGIAFGQGKQPSVAFR